MSEYIVQTRRLTKHYGGVKALTEVDLSFEPGLIHALVGENGAGKSTLIRILSGIEPPTSGEVLFEGGLVEEFSPHAAHDRGISTVYQEPMQVGLMTIEENIYVGRYEKNRLGFVDYRALRRKVTALMDEIGIHLPPRAVVGELSVAKRQMVEILKALSFRSRFIIFDEPTASLTTEECDNLKQIIRRLKEQGITVLYISHRLEEIFDLCDTVTVLRDGMFVGKRQVSEIDQDQLIRMMVGRSMENLFPKKEVLIGEQILELRHVESASVHDISFTLHRGGDSGLRGAGRRGAHRDGERPVRDRPLFRAGAAGGEGAENHLPRRGDRRGDRAGARGPQAPGAGAADVGAGEHHPEQPAKARPRASARP